MNRVEKFSHVAGEHLRELIGDGGHDVSSLGAALLALAPCAELRVVRDALGFVVVLRMRSLGRTAPLAAGYARDFGTAVRQCAAAALERCASWGALGEKVDDGSGSDGGAAPPASE